MKMQSTYVLGFAGLAILGFLVSLAFLLRSQSDPWADRKPVRKEDPAPLPPKKEVISKTQNPPPLLEPAKAKERGRGRPLRPPTPKPDAPVNPEDERIVVQPAEKPAFEPGVSFNAEKTLASGDRAYINSNLDDTQRFYEEFELLHAGSNEYDRKAEHVWERLAQVYDARGKTPAAVREHLGARKGLHLEWLRIKAQLKEGSVDSVDRDLRSLLSSLPPRDGRIAIITSWLETDSKEK